MKQKGRHPDKALNAVKVRSLAKPGRYADGNGLYLIVDVSGAKRWILRTVVRGRRCDLGLGSLSLVSLPRPVSKRRTIERSQGLVAIL
jgi:Arm DNA-binding domain